MRTQWIRADFFYLFLNGKIAKKLNLFISRGKTDTFSKNCVWRKKKSREYSKITGILTSMAHLQLVFLCIRLLNQYFLFTHIEGHVNTMIAKTLIISGEDKKKRLHVIKIVVGFSAGHSTHKALVECIF